MVELIQDFPAVLLVTLRDVLPIGVVIILFQVFVLRQPIPQLKRVILGGFYVLLGLAFFILGLGIPRILATACAAIAFSPKCICVLFGICED